MRTRTTTPMTAAAAFALLLGSLTACAPTPAPTPTPSGYASEEDAFTAAEQTYRAYVDAVNARRADPESSADPTDFLTGQALTAEINSNAKFRDAEISLHGDTSIHSFSRIAATGSTTTLNVCLDVSGTRVLDASGADVTPPDRADLLGLSIETLWSADRTFISSTLAVDSC